jgi:hypothetical protein
VDGVRAIALSQIQFGAQAGLKETAQDLAMDGTKADLQLQERAGMRVSLNQGGPSTEIWGIAVLDQRRRRTQNHLAKIAPRRESWIKHNRYYYDLLGRLLRFLVPGPSYVTAVRGLERYCTARSLQLRKGATWG